MFIIADGIDGSGKSTVVVAWKEYLVSQGNPVFDLTEFWTTQGRYPELAEVRSYDFIVSSEPTRVGIGATIRAELIHHKNTYPHRSIAEAFALDRLVLYTRLLIPLLADGKCILQDRGVSSSLMYQAWPEMGVTQQFLLELDGNKLAMDHAPDHLVLVTVPPELALQRLRGRHDKQDDVIFENETFLRRTAGFLASPEFQTIFTGQGTRIHELSGAAELAIMKAEAIRLLKGLLT